MGNAVNQVKQALEIEGALAAALVDGDSGMMLASAGDHSFDLEIAAAGHTELLRAELKTMRALGINDTVQDILVSLGQQYHILRPLRVAPSIFFYLALDRTRANLAMARHLLSVLEASTTL